MPFSLSHLIIAVAVAGIVPPSPGPHRSHQAPVPAQVQAAQEAPVPFAEWLADLRKEALAAGIGEKTVTAALTGIEPAPVVVERDRSQVERTLTIDEYLERRIDRQTVKTAREMAKRHGELLARVSATYGVPSSVVVAIWGLESNFGRFSGVRPTILSLVTLAYDNRRAGLFRQELLNALRILDHGDVDLDRMKGSWAGAMGQAQFMPSSYLQYAQDFDKDGRRDIWMSEADVFASIANYLKRSGWKAGVPWGCVAKVRKKSEAAVEKAAPLHAQGCEAVRQMSEALPLSRWKALGVSPRGRRRMPPPRTLASLVRAGSHDFLVFDNYSALLQYNCAHAYALAVALLADQIH